MNFKKLISVLFLIRTGLFLANAQPSHGPYPTPGGGGSGGTNNITLTGVVGGGPSSGTLSTTFTPTGTNVINSLAGAQVTSATVNAAVPGIVTNNVLISSYILSNSISDPLAKSDLLNGYNELNSYSGDFRSNLTDAVILYSRFNTNYGRTTLLGRNMLMTNVTYNANGAVITNATILIPGLPTLSTNFTVITFFKYPRNIGNSSQGLIATVVNPVTSSAFGLWSAEQQYEKYWFSIGTNVFGNSSQQYTNLILAPYPNSTYGFSTQVFENTARSIALSISGTNLTEWDGYNQGQINNYAQGFVGNPPLQTDSLTNLIIGNWNYTNLAPAFMPAVHPSFEVDCVLIFSVPATSNLIIAANRFVRWLDPATQESYGVGDSLIAPDFSLNNSVTNGSFYYLMSRQGSNNRWVNAGIGGTKLDAYDTAYFSNYYFGPGLIDKIDHADMHVAAGINDNYQSGISGTTTFGHLFNIRNMAFNADPRWRVYAWNEQPIGQTNNVSTGGYNYSTNGEINRVLFNSLINSNASLFSGVFRRDQLVNQFLMNTNNGYSTDGLHFHNTTNAWVIWNYMSQNWGIYGDYGARPFVDFNGNYVPSVGSTNSIGGATNFVGDVAGTNNAGTATLTVTNVGGVSAASVASGANAANAATTNATGGTIVLRDANGYSNLNPAGNGTNLTNLNASQINGGTVVDARLSANVALLNGNQAFSGNNTFTASNTVFQGVTATNLSSYSTTQTNAAFPIVVQTSPTNISVSFNGGALTNLNISTNTSPLVQYSSVITATNTVYSTTVRATMQGSLTMFSTVVAPCTGYIATTNGGIAHVYPFYLSGLATNYFSINGIQLSTNSTFQFVVTGGSVYATNAWLNY